VKPYVDESRPSAEPVRNPGTPVKSIAPVVALMIVSVGVQARIIGSAASMVVIAGYTLFLAWRGYRRRRAYWTSGSWLALTVAVLAGVALLAFAFVISAAVDNHESWVGPAHSDVRSGWTLAAVGAMIGGVLMSIGSLAWFANGEPTRQLSLERSLEPRVRAQ